MPRPGPRPFFQLQGLREARRGAGWMLSAGGVSGQPCPHMRPLPGRHGGQAGATGTWEPVEEGASQVKRPWVRIPVPPVLSCVDRLQAQFALAVRHGLVPAPSFCRARGSSWGLLLLASGCGCGLRPTLWSVGRGDCPAEGERINLLCRAPAPGAPTSGPARPRVGVCVRFLRPFPPPGPCRQNKHRACFPTNRPTIFQTKGKEGENAASLINCDVNSSATQQLSS